MTIVDPWAAPPILPNEPAVEHLGRYEVTGRIGRGGMGEVLLGRDPDLGRELALKVLLPECVRRPDLLRRFLEEAQIGGRLQHPGIVPVYELGRVDDRAYFTMKLVKGKTLAELLEARNGELPGERGRQPPVVHPTAASSTGSTSAPTCSARGDPAVDPDRQAAILGPFVGGDDPAGEPGRPDRSLRPPRRGLYPSPPARRRPKGRATAPSLRLLPAGTAASGRSRPADHRAARTPKMT